MKQFLFLLTVPVFFFTPCLAQKTPKGWSKIIVSDRISFYLPPKLTKAGRPGNNGFIQDFKRDVANGSDFYIGYAYGKSVPRDLNTSQGKANRIMISGKRAVLNVWERSFDGFKADPSGIDLLVPHLGEGEDKFEIYIVGSDLAIMRQIIDSVEFD